MGKCIRGHATNNATPEDFDCDSCNHECLFRGISIEQASIILEHHKCWGCNFWCHQGYGKYECACTNEQICPKEEFRTCYVCHSLFVAPIKKEKIFCDICEKEWIAYIPESLSVGRFTHCYHCDRETLEIKKSEDFDSFFEDYVKCNHCRWEFMYHYQKVNGRKLFILTKKIYQEKYWLGAPEEIESD